MKAMTALKNIKKCYMYSKNYYWLSYIMIRIFQKNVVSVVYDVTQHVYYCTIFSLLEHSDIKAVIFYINLALPPLVNIKIYYLLHQRMRLRFISTHIYSKKDRGT